MSLFYQISSFNEDIVRNLQTRKAMLLAAEQLDVSGKCIDAYRDHQSTNVQNYCLVLAQDINSIEDTKELAW